VRKNWLVLIMCYLMRRLVEPRRARHQQTRRDGGWARSGEADVQAEVPEPQVEYSAASPVHDERQQDDGQDNDDHPEEEHHDAGDGIPGYSSRSSHGHQLPTDGRLIPRVFTVTATPDLVDPEPESRPGGRTALRTRSGYSSTTAAGSQLRHGCYIDLAMSSSATHRATLAG